MPPIAGEVKELAGKLPDLYQNLQVYLSGDSPLYDPMIAEKTLAAKKLNLALIGETKEDTVLKSLLNSYQKKF